jgi:phosphatidylserine/phosphatidylglycerophosphate/cardiolipin synthase-like enzyme
MIGRTTRALALLLALAASPLGLARGQTAEPRPYFSPNGGGAEATAALIDAAQRTVDVAMYSVSSGPSNPIWTALQRAVQRGVRVRFILNAATGANRSKATALQGLGVHVYGVTHTLHEKFAIVDAELPGAALVNGSANWSLGAMTKYSENTTVFPAHPHLVYAFQEEFNRLLARARPLSPGADQQMAPVTLSPQAVASEQAFFTTTNAGGSTVVADEIIRVMQTAERSVQIDVAHFDARSICQALIALHQQKPALRIEVLVDLGEYAASASRARDLERAGIEVRYKTYSLAYNQGRAQLMHHKTLIVDEARVVSGSYNWSDTAENSNYENVMFIDGAAPQDASCVAAFVAEHERLWTMGRDVYPRFRAFLLAQPGNAMHKAIIPVHFDTPYFDQIMTLTRRELAPLRSVAYGSGLIERLPSGKTKTHSEATYLDRDARAPYSGPAPQGRFLDPVTTGLSGGLPGQ